ncbi:unnamed protein product [Diatraea saccharalis]|uniref:Uncharacterized protein n=1 Tax=Diatraea saccharalis TaxID=40085 RepID=A0A9N9WIX4_9NEOP|nr:unnamed protein product [Diatraea saccharalis]
MATAKRKQEELGEECDDQEPHDNDPCSDDDDAKRPRLDLHHQHMTHHQLPHHRQNINEAKYLGSERTDNNIYSNFGMYPEYIVPRTFCKESVSEDTPCDLSNWQRMKEYEQTVENERDAANASEVESEQETFHNGDNLNNDDVQQPINFAYYHF